jgi:hypothetical protein
MDRIGLTALACLWKNKPAVARNLGQQAHQNPHAYSEVSISGFRGRGIRGLCLCFHFGCDLLAGAFLRIAHRNDGCIAALRNLDAEQIISTLAGIVFAKTIAQTTRFYPDRCVNRRVILGPSLKYIDCDGVLFGRRIRQRLLDNIPEKGLAAGCSRKDL